MNLWSSIGFPEKYRYSELSTTAKQLIHRLSASYIFILCFTVTGVCIFCEMAMHNLLIDLITSLIIGFVLWNITRLNNASIQIAPHIYNDYRLKFDKFNIDLLIWEDCSEEEKKNTPRPYEPKLPIPSFFVPTLLFLWICVLSGMVLGIFFSTDYFVSDPEFPDALINQEILTRLQIAQANGWLSIGGTIGLCIALIPNIIRIVHYHEVREMYRFLAEKKHVQITNSYQKHLQYMSDVSPFENANYSPFEDPPFNTKFKIMGWIPRDKVYEIKPPPKPKDKDQEADSSENNQDTSEQPQESQSDIISENEHIEDHESS